MFSKYYNKIIQPYLVAEIGVNHSGNLNLAKKQIYLAKKGGANAVKFQTYKADKITSKYNQAYWDQREEKTSSQIELFKKYDKFNEKDYILLSKYCKKINIDFSSTPFDLDSVDYLKKIVKFFKISSSDITNFELIKKVAKTNLPICLSTGASNIDEIREARNLIRKYNNKELVIMHCILSYPTRKEDANLLMIEDLKKNFNKELIGYSDHTKPSKNMEIVKTAFILGSRVIEKHFTHNKNLKGNDHYHAMDKFDLLKLRKCFGETIKILGESKKFCIKIEKKSKKYARRSLIAKSNILKGQSLKKSLIILKRPGTGISPKNLYKVLGKKTKKFIKEDQVIKWSDIKI